MTLGNRIAGYRKQMGLTQEALANRLDVTNQAISKWESDQCCPDILLLPKIADIFEITIDALFGRGVEAKEPAVQELPWEDDGALRAVLYVGRKLIAGHKAAREIQFCYEGPALNVHSEFSVNCESVDGDVTANGSVNCADVGGSVSAGGNVTCDEVAGSASAGGNVTCDSVDGDVHAGGSVTCDEVAGDVFAGGDVHCDHAEGGIFKA